MNVPEFETRQDGAMRAVRHNYGLSARGWGLWMALVTVFDLLTDSLFLAVVSAAFTAYWFWQARRDELTYRRSVAMVEAWRNGRR